MESMNIAEGCIFLDYRDHELHEAGVLTTVCE